MANLNIRQMEIYIKQLEMQLQAKSAQVEQLNQYISKASKETQEIVSGCRKFCISILEKDLIKGGISANELQTMPLIELTQKALKAYKAEQIENRKILEKFSEKLSSKNIMIQSLETQNAQLLMKNSQIMNSFSQQQREEIPDESESDISIQKPTAYFNDVNEDSPVQSPAINDIKIDSDTDNELNAFAMSLAHESADDQVSNVRKKVKRQDADSEKQLNFFEGEVVAGTSQFEVIDMNRIKEQLSPLCWVIIEIIGKDGTSEFPEIKQKILEMVSWNSDIKITQINTALKELKKIDAIDAVKISTGIRWFYAYSLRETGHKMFVDKYKTVPVKPEIEILSKEHDNPLHGYLIKDASKIIQDIYKCNISISRKNNYIKLPNHKAIIPDVIASLEDKNMYYEMETGHHTQSDFNDKCNKMTMITNELYFIVPDQKTCDKIKEQIKKWISSNKGGREALEKSNITVYLTTMRQITKKNWTVIFDMSSDDPIIRPNIGDDG